MNENSVAFLTPEYQEILQNAEKYKDEYKRSPSHLERLYGKICLKQNSQVKLQIFKFYFFILQRQV